jgi:drug/metabolite transporter (DMT)-like permease
MEDRVSRTQLTIVLVLALTCIGVLADAALKLASTERHVVQSKWFFIGLGLSCAFAVGWMFLMRVMKIATAGVIYGVASALVLCLIGVFVFHERLSTTEVAGVAAAMLAIVLLGVDA